MRFRNPTLIGFALVTLSLAAPHAAVAAGTKIEVQSQEPLGQYITDAKGTTLYLFEKDERGSKSTCSGACASSWPPLVTDGDPVAGSGLDASKLSTIERKDGSRQVTYGGWPLYYFVKDKQPGDTKGQDVEGFGAEWYAVSPDGNKAESEEHEEEEEGY